MTQRTYAVTGVASGIGASVATKLTNQGHRVIGLDINQPSIQLAQFVEVDLCDSIAIGNAAGQIAGNLDGLCNNAGLPPRAGLEEKILQLNFLGVRTLTRHLIPLMNAGSSIVNVASRAGHGWQQQIDQIKRLGAIDSDTALLQFIETENIDPTRAYNLSKEAIILWTLAETEALIAKSIRINSVSPGAIDTVILADFKQAFGDAVEHNLARVGRPGSTEEIATTISFLLNPESRWVNGTDVAMDGGIGAFNTADRLGLEVMKVLE